MKPETYHNHRNTDPPLSRRKSVQNLADQIFKSHITCSVYLYMYLLDGMKWFGPASLVARRCHHQPSLVRSAAGKHPIIIIVYGVVSTYSSSRSLKCKYIHLYRHSNFNNRITWYLLTEFKLAISISLMGANVSYSALLHAPLHYKPLRPYPIMIMTINIFPPTSASDNWQRAAGVLRHSLYHYMRSIKNHR